MGHFSISHSAKEGYSPQIQPLQDPLQPLQDQELEEVYTPLLDMLLIIYYITQFLLHYQFMYYLSLVCLLVVPFKLIRACQVIVFLCVFIYVFCNFSAHGSLVSFFLFLLYSLLLVIMTQIMTRYWRTFYSWLWYALWNFLLAFPYLVMHYASFLLNQLVASFILL